MRAPPIFIGGLNRTGTSLARQLVGSHPLVAIPPTELEFFKHLHVPLNRGLGRDEARRLVDEVLSWPKVAGWSLDRADVLARLDAGEPDARGVFVSILSSFANGAGKPRWGEKTTSYEERLGTLERWFGGDFAFVHMIRHPVSAYASQRWYKGVERDLDVKSWAAGWRRSVMTGLVALARHGSRYVVVRYEDLVRDTDRELERMCAAADIDYDDRMLTMVDFDQVDNSSFSAQQADSRYRGGVREADHVTRADRIPPSALAHLRATCRGVAARVGYDVDDETALSPVATTGRLVRLRLALAAGSAHSLGRRVRSRMHA